MCGVANESDKLFIRAQLEEDPKPASLPNNHYLASQNQASSSTMACSLCAHSRSSCCMCGVAVNCAASASTCGLLPLHHHINSSSPPPPALQQQDAAATSAAQDATPTSSLSASALVAAGAAGKRCNALPCDAVHHMLCHVMQHCNALPCDAVLVSVSNPKLPMCVHKRHCSRRSRGRV